MAMRNWWSVANVDGRKNNVTFGPKGNDGRFSQAIFQKVNGTSQYVAGLHGHEINGDLRLSVVAAESEGVVLEVWVNGRKLLDLMDGESVHAASIEVRSKQ